MTMRIGGLIDGSVCVDLLSCYLEFKYALSVLFTSVTFPLPHLSDVDRVPDGLSAKIFRRLSSNHLAALRVVTHLLRYALQKGGGASARCFYSLGRHSRQPKGQKFEFGNSDGSDPSGLRVSMFYRGLILPPAAKNFSFLCLDFGCR